MNYSTPKLVTMIYIIGESNGKFLLATRLYAQRFPERRHLDIKSLQKLKEMIVCNGSVEYERTLRRKRVLNEENQQNILLAAVENSNVSVREISRELEIKKSSVAKCLKTN